MKMELQSTMKDLLSQHKGKDVTLRLTSGEEVGGDLEEVGDELVHIARLTGREFYDAVVRLESIAALVVRTRTR